MPGSWELLLCRWTAGFGPSGDPKANGVEVGVDPEGELATRGGEQEADGWHGQARDGGPLECRVRLVVKSVKSTNESVAAIAATARVCRLTENLKDNGGLSQVPDRLGARSG
jgi:hypothetical protein